MTIAPPLEPGVVATAAAPIPTPESSEDPWRPLDIAGERCKACELCISVCTHGALALDTTIVNRLGYHPIRLIDEAACTSCVLCARICPDAVFTVYAPRKAART